jgi:hypothetical protein
MGDADRRHVIGRSAEPRHPVARRRHRRAELHDAGRPSDTGAAPPGAVLARIELERERELQSA